MPKERPSGKDADFFLGDWLIRPRHGGIRKRAAPDAQPIALEPRVMDVLVCLAQRYPDVVTRDEFHAEVWRGRIVADEALSRCISVLRTVLGDSSQEPRYIRTISKVGYTLLIEPEWLPAAERSPPAAISAPAERPTTAPPPPMPAPPAAAADASESPAVSPASGGRWRKWLFGGAAAIVLAGAVAVYWLRPVPPAAPLAPIASLAVLPFDTTAADEFGRDVGNELGDELVDWLQQVEQLRIVGRTSSDAARAAHLDPADAGRTLGVDAVLSGTVAGGRKGLKVSVRFTDVRTRETRWTKGYQFEPADLFSVQRRIALLVARSVGPAGRNPERELNPVEPESRDVEAYLLYVRGAHQLRLRGEDSLRKAVELFSAAARRDPSYARPYVGLGTAYSLLPSYTFEDPADMFALADKSLATADRLSGSRLASAGTRAYIAFQRWHWIEAEAAFRTALTAEPNNSDVYQLYSQLLGAVGRLDAALERAQQASSLDPLAPVVADRIGVLHLWRGEDQAAAKNIALAREYGLEEAAYPETTVILRLHEHSDADAIDTLRRLQRALNRSEAWIEPTISAYRHPEQRPAAIALLDQAQRSGAMSPRIYFGAMVLLGASGRAMHAFEGLIDRDPNDLEFLFSQDAAAVRRDPGFGGFAEKMGLVKYWERFGWPAACRRDGAQIRCH